ncbi:ArgE/DapE family deacylase [Aeromicrobium endophyticum]|uniref:M20/M25/M40 family metallo-hydrolase n=1 Tax=Aeromicrobium endophyticum TaxID=2292704 RepID=A0A371PBF2_9ACTN|nr:ArgE/DapE family deacylase [Aeromicrobium endophyticum]REK73255.1 M20/M25/M40 family metallo-hydrolase [Aeromicrobium endophyticum]
MDIDVDLIRRDLAQLVNIPSTGGSDAEVAVQRWCAATLTGLGLDVDQWRLDLDALRADPEYPGEEVERAEAWGVVGTSGEGTPALILNGHVDVVPPGEPDSWTNSDPWHVREVDDRWFGRGVCDMKGGVVAIIAAARAVSDLELSRPFAVHSVVGEEDGGIGTFGTLRRGHTGDACIIAEPTAGRVVAANAGSLTFRIEVQGRSTHGSMRATGHSAISAFEVIHAALAELEDVRNQAPPEPFGSLPWPISVGIVCAGDWASTVPDRLVAEGRYGVMPGESFADAEAAFEQAVQRVAEADTWLAEHPPVVTWPGGRFAAGRLPQGEPFGDQVATAVVSAGQPLPDLVGAPYGSDLRQYATAGIPTVQYGPGDIADAHAVDESVSIAEVVACATAYAELIVARCR